MTKVELVNRIMEVTTPNQRARQGIAGTRGIILDCVDGFVETLLLQVRNQTETALEKVITDTVGLVRSQGRKRQESDEGE